MDVEIKEEVKEEVKEEQESSSSEQEDSTDNESDLDMDIEELARRPVRPQPQRRSAEQEVPVASQPTTEEVMDVDSDDDDDENADEGEEAEEQEDNRRYGLRKRNTQLSYKGMTVASDDDEDNEKMDNGHSPSKKNKRLKRKDILELTPLLTKSERSEKLRNKFMKQPNLIETPGKWRLSCDEAIWSEGEELDVAHFNTIKKFLEKNARHMDHLVLVLKRSNKVWDMILDVVSCLCRHAIFMANVSILYSKKMPEEDMQLLHILETLKRSGPRSLKSLKIVSLGNGGLINAEELEALNELSEAGIKLTSVELGDAILVTKELKAVDGLAKFLELGKDTLEKLLIHGGFKGSSDVDYDVMKSKLMLQFPKKMPVLRELSICPRYTFESNSYEHKDPASKRWREVVVKDNDKPTVPLKLTLVLDHTEFSQLKKMVLGNMIDMEECSFGLLRNLRTFRCGSRWDLIVTFPKTESKRGPGRIKELQFPDGLKDPSFVVKVAKFFPSLQKVWIYLPSVAVLRSFFDSYRNSSVLEELHLKTQFDFETTMESCLLPDQIKKRKLSKTSRAVIQKLKEYKHFKEYVRYHNIELPLEFQDDQDELRSNGAGIRALECLKVLHLEHIPRQLLIPNPEDERKCHDHNLKYLNTKFGYLAYPVSKKCDAAISAMNLREYRYNNIKTAAFKGCSNLGLSESDDDFDDLFTLKRNTRATRIRIKPFMLVPDHLNKDKIESNSD